MQEEKSRGEKRIGEKNNPLNPPLSEGEITPFLYFLITTAIFNKIKQILIVCSYIFTIFSKV